MSETNVTNVTEEQDIDSIIANSPFAKALSISRNGVSETLKVFVGKRGAWENKPYAAVQIETDEAKDFDKDHAFINALKWIGKSNVKNFLNTILRRVGQDYVDDAISDATGEFSLDAFQKSWENLAAAGLKLAELKELLDAEQRKHEAYIAGEGMEKLTSGDHHLMAEAKSVIENRTKNIKALRFELEQRAARRSKEQATETVSPE